jgi:hypothetical protein
LENGLNMQNVPLLLFNFFSKHGVYLGRNPERRVSSQHKNLHCCLKTWSRYRKLEGDILGRLWNRKILNGTSDNGLKMGPCIRPSGEFLLNG